MQNIITDLEKNNIKLDSSTIKKIQLYYARLHSSNYSKENAQFYYECLTRHFDLAKYRVGNEILIDAFDLCKTELSKNPDTIINLVLPDIPFVLDTIKIRLALLGETVNRITSVSFAIERDINNNIIDVNKFKDEHLEDNIKFESFLQFQLEQVPDSKIADIKLHIVQVIQTIEIIVADWLISRNKLLQIADLVSQKPEAEYQQIGDFLRWLEKDNFAILGIVELNDNYETKIETGLGLFKKEVGDIINTDGFFPNISSKKLKALTISKMAKKLYIHREDYMDNIIIKYDGNIFCFVGFFSSTSFANSVLNIPYVKDKINYVINKSNYRKGRHAHKTLLNITENLPREWLFQTEQYVIFEVANSILNNNEIRQTNVYINKDICGHFYTVFVYVPKDIFNTVLRKKIEKYLSDELDASEILFQVYFSDYILTRIQFNIYSAKKITVDYEKIITNIKGLALDWNLELYKEFKLHYNIDVARKFINEYQDSFPTLYQNTYTPANAVSDIIKIKNIFKSGIETNIFKTYKDGIKKLYLKLYVKGIKIRLSDILPIFDNMGVYVNSEQPFKINKYISNTQIALIRSFDIKRKDDLEFDLTYSKIFLEGFKAVLDEKIENDGFNSLIIKSKLNIYQINVLRSIFRYLKQIGFLYSMYFTINTLIKNYKVTQLLFKLFDIKFNPSLSKKSSVETYKQIINYLELISSLDEDTVIRAYLEIINSALLRTNFYQQNNADYIVYKIKSNNISFMPSPSPKYEIFVYSVKFEGVHLRLGDIARGGLRWSERVEDYRTEILGLVKAQQVKNTVIVPVGSKGGFVLKNLSLNKEQMLSNGIYCYKQFIQALIGITDNLVDGKIIKPKRTNVLDGDDPYLVVAADKGTATFSDMANAISRQNNFWLGDAFASGGSIGYDHKKMGITARGGWESVKRHFRELGKNIQNEDFTVVGIGDMSGDVFGNAMLLSKHIKLIAAFNHRHIFIDPKPDAATSFTQRQRLFDLASSTWLDYPSEYISKGGGVYERSAKSITLSKEAKNILATAKNKCSPNDLINLILQAKVELLWNGGIGTYVIASSENNQDAQDKVNDKVRVNSSLLKCQVIGEGGNLGLTQLARIEYCLLGGKCYNDAIDNSAGVDCSDHEVNIKILLNIMINEGTISTTERNKILESMEAEVAQFCLHNNYAQTQTISVFSQPNSNRLANQINAFDCLANSGLLDRENEFVISNEILKERLTTTKCLTKPELAILLAYSKMDLYQKLLKTSICDDKFLLNSLLAYFPSLISQNYADVPKKHRLKNEIILTVVTNDLVNKLGPSFHINAHFLTGCNYLEIAKTYLITNKLLNIDDLFNKIKSLDNKVASSVQYDMFIMLSETQINNIYYLLLNYENIDINNFLNKYNSCYQKLFACVKKQLADRIGIKQDKLLALNVDKDIAFEVAATSILYNILDIMDIADSVNTDYNNAIDYYLKASTLLNIYWLNVTIKKLDTPSNLHVKAVFNLLNRSRKAHYKITLSALKMQSFSKFEQTKADDICLIKSTINELKETRNIDFAILSVLVNDLEKLTKVLQS